MAKKKSLIHIGTSGWYYEHWNKVFYPEDLASTERLPFYAENFDTVEINNTFYRLPTTAAVKNWYEKTPENFLFTVKSSGYITHRKRLLEGKRTLKDFLKVITLLDHKLGPILFQLPPTFKYNYERVEEFISYLPKNLHCVFEFRHPSWYVDETYELFQKNNIALCISDLKGKLSPLEITSNFTYIRLHGPHLAYRGYYSNPQLKKWAERIEEWSSNKIGVYCYFDNDEKGFAVKDALRLKKMLGIT